MKIFVTIGTYQPFDRLIETVDRWIKDRPEHEGFAQIGGGKFIPENMKYDRTMSEHDFNRVFHFSDLIVSHAGMGTIISSLQTGKLLITLPRVAEFGEHVNDHQLANAKIFSEKGYIYPIFNEKDLIEKLENLSDIKILKEISDSANQSLLDFLSSLV